MRVCISIVVLFIGQAIVAQSNWKLFPKDRDSQTEDEIVVVDQIKAESKPGIIQINNNPKIDSLSKELGTPADGVSVKIQGYRLQIIASNKSELVNAERAKLAAMNSSIPSYVNYIQPNFRLRLGDFRTKLEAQKAQYELRDVFPSALVVTDMIELPKVTKD